MPDSAYSPGRPTPSDRARILSLLFFGGTALGLAAIVLLPLPPGTNIPGTLVTIGVALASGLVLFFGAGRLPSWATAAALALGTLVISLDIYFAGDIRTDDEMFYLWVAFYAFYFLPVRVAVGELALVGVGYAVAIALRHEPDASTRWVITVGTLALAGMLTARVVGQLERWARHSRNRERALRQAEERFRSAFEDAAVGMALVDLSGRWLRVNEALARLTGYAPADLVGKQFQQLSIAEELPTDLQALEQLAAGERNVYQTEKRYTRRDGGIVWVALSVSLVRDDEGNPLSLISQMQDITDRKAAEHELAERALHDPLTGLPNRLLFLDRVGMALARIERDPVPVAVFFIDLDRFKLVNDSLGHAIGDEMLIDVAQRLKCALRPSDTVSRFGGDEFTILCENTGEDAAREVARRISVSLSKPFAVGGHELYVSASVGVSICRDSSIGAEAMLRDADAAMYRAKERGRSQFVVFDGAMRLRATQRLEVENDLRHALDRDELRLHYQPLVELGTGEIGGVEALLRWEHPQRGLLEPDQFIHVAEECGLIGVIGEWTIGEACRQASEWQREGHAVGMSINLSPLQLLDPRLPETVAAIIDRSAAAPELLCFEISERAAVDAGLAQLGALKELGVSLALDDFGTGFSSLNQIRRLPPVDILKIDRSFIVELGRRRADSAIVAAIISMARALKLVVIAEGITRELQVRELQALGCERGQGFYFARPSEPDAVKALFGAPAAAITESPAPMTNGDRAGVTGRSKPAELRV
jgi:diguanylate cyclase (GGDEF)-like protein/PAS domain S-box-containing protein